MKFVFLLWIFFFSSPLFAEETFYDQQIRPGLLKSTDLTSLQLLVGGALGVTATHQRDDEMHDRWRDHQMWSQDTSRWGDNYGRYGIGVLFSLGQIYFDHDNGINHLRALLANGVVTTTLKYTVRRERPHRGDSLSFPSGHTSDAFTTATSLTYAYGWKAGIIAYPLATFVGLSRVADEAHWLSDVTAGAFIGIWMGRAFFYSTENQAKDHALDFHWHLQPEIDSDFTGLHFACDF